MDKNPSVVEKEILICGKFCMPCNMVKQWLADNNLEIETVYGEDNMDLCRSHHITRTPTLLITRDVEGSEYQAYECISTPEEIEKYLAKKYLQ